MAGIKEIAPGLLGRIPQHPWDPGYMEDLPDVLDPSRARRAMHETPAVRCEPDDVVDLPMGYHEANEFKLRYGRFPNDEVIEFIERNHRIPTWDEMRSRVRTGRWRKSTSTNRYSCSLCGQDGHNRRTCGQSQVA